METTASSFPGYFATKTGNDALTEVTAVGINDLRRDVAKSESDIRGMMGDDTCKILSKLGDVECSITKNDADIANRATIHLNSVERDIQNRIHENRSILLADSAAKTDRIVDRMNDFERSTAEKFCDVKSQVKDSERRVLDQLAADKLDEKNNLIAELRAEKYQDKCGYQFGLQNQELNYLKQMINSVEQTQKFSSKTVQFGTGNLAGTAQTANQG